MVESDEQPERGSSGGGGVAMAALHQCELIQNMIDISISSLQGLRTKCAASNDLTQQEIRTLEVSSLPDLSWHAASCLETPSNCGVMKPARRIRLNVRAAGSVSRGGPNKRARSGLEHSQTGVPRIYLPLPDPSISVICQEEGEAPVCAWPNGTHSIIIGCTIYWQLVMCDFNDHFDDMTGDASKKLNN